MKIVVLHSSYGCDTGCCGHVIQFYDGDDVDEHFEFDHPYGRDPLEFAKDLVTEQYGADHVKDLAWDECIISDD